MNKFTIASLLLAISAITSVAHAETKSIITYSTSGKSMSSDVNLMKEEIANNKALLLSDQVLGKQTGKTREQVIAQKKQASKNSPNKSMKKSSSFYFAIYDGYSQLIEDIDYDGFYRTFSVTFDADIVSQHKGLSASVYAELYIRRNNGPWTHYYTTDSFNIYDDNTDDSFEVYSTLEAGFPSDEYDILIDLYEVGVEGVVATFSSDDSNSLYALPLEDSTYDVEEVVVVVESHGHGGSSSEIFLSLLLLALGYRLQMQDKNEA